MDVLAEDLETGAVRATNSARMFYARVAVCAKPAHETLSWTHASASDMPPKLRVIDEPIPPVPGLTGASLEAGHERYLAQKRSRASGLEAASVPRRPGKPPLLSHLVLPSEVHSNGTVFGGVVLKLMDSAAGTAAVSYCKSNAVTASLDALNFEAPVFVGNVVRVYSHVTFTSSKSLEVVVLTEAEDLVTGDTWRAVSGHLTMVALDDDGKVVPVPPLIPKTHEEREDFAAGERRYQMRKAARRGDSN